MSARHVAIGLDAGGSTTQVVAEWEGASERVECRGPAANPNRVGIDRSAQVLSALVREGTEARGPIDRLAVCAGVAGAGRPDDQRALADRLRRELAGDADVVVVEVVHDACIALEAAFGPESGLVIIVGTGSVVWARTRAGTTRRTGGWGHRLGDPGSGYAVGRAGLRAVAAAFDGGTDTALRARVAEAHGIDERAALLHEVYQEDLPLQDVAPLVVAAAADGDPVATDILASQIDDLLRQVEGLLRETDDVAPRIALLGGMLRSDHYKTALREALADRFPDRSVKVPQEKPVVGALRRARRLKG